MNVDLANLIVAVQGYVPARFHHHVLMERPARDQVRSLMTRATGDAYE